MLNWLVTGKGSIYVVNLTPAFGRAYLKEALVVCIERGDGSPESRKKLLSVYIPYELISGHPSSISSILDDQSERLGRTTTHDWYFRGNVFAVPVGNRNAFAALWEQKRSE